MRHIGERERPAAFGAGACAGSLQVVLASGTGDHVIPKVLGDEDRTRAPTSFHDGSDLRNEVLAIVLGGEGRPGYGHAVKLNRVDDHEARQALHIAIVRPRASAIEVGGDHPNALVGEVKLTGRGRSRGDASSGGGHGGDASKRRETADADDGGGQADRDEHHLHGAQPAQCKERTRKTEDQGEAAGERDGSSPQDPRKLAMFAREVNTPFRRCGDELRAESARAFLGEHDLCLKLPWLGGGC